jgi:hypothetical protein
MKPKDIMWALEAEGVVMDHETHVGTFMGRNIRVNCNQTVDIGDDDFDRWANSVAAEFNPEKKKFSRQFKRACQDAGIAL